MLCKNTHTGSFQRFCTPLPLIKTARSWVHLSTSQAANTIRSCTLLKHCRPLPALLAFINGHLIMLPELLLQKVATSSTTSLCQGTASASIQQPQCPLPRTTPSVHRLAQGPICSWKQRPSDYSAPRDSQCSLAGAWLSAGHSSPAAFSSGMPWWLQVCLCEQPTLLKFAHGERQTSRCRICNDQTCIEVLLMYWCPAAPGHSMSQSAVCVCRQLSELAQMS